MCFEYELDPCVSHGSGKFMYKLALAFPGSEREIYRTGVFDVGRLECALVLYPFLRLACTLR